MNPDKAIIYDANCPMCHWYTRQFVDFKLLDPRNRISFQEVEHTGLHTCIDPNRSRLEIPLVDRNGGQTLYGIDSLVYLLNPRFPWIGRVMQIGLVRSFMLRLYHLISFNRRIISGNTGSPIGMDCTPPMHRGYRITFLVFAAVVAVLITNWLAQTVATLEWVQLPAPIIFAAIATGWVFQGISAGLFLRNDLLDYLGHLATVMLVGVLVLLPGLIATATIGNLGLALLLPCLLLSAGLMFNMHRKRTRLLGLRQRWHLLWTSYLAVAFTGIPLLFELIQKTP